MEVHSRKIITVLLYMMIALALPCREASANELEAKREELKSVEQEIQELESAKQEADSEAEQAAHQLRQADAKLRASQIQLDQTALTISDTQTDQVKTAEDIQSLQADMKNVHTQMSQTIRALYEHDQTTFIDLLLGSQTLSTLYTERRTYYQLQEQALALIQSIRDRQQELQEKQETLEEQHRQLQKLELIQLEQQESLDEEKQEKDNLLRQSQAEQARYQQKIAEAEQARKEIEQDIFQLKGLNVRLSLNDANDIARYASSVTGVRPALLLAMVKVETNVGQNLGSGVFPDDMHPASRDAFLRLTKKLNRDPRITPISRRPASYIGWGGAVGPGQFMPDTWERIEPRVSQLMNKPTPDPFELTDAMVGVGIMLADRGATSPTKEVEAVSRYIAGPNWQYHTWFAQKVLAVAVEYEQQGL